MMQWEDMSVRLGAVRGVWRVPGGDDLRGLRAAGALAPGGALAGPQGGGGRCRSTRCISRVGILPLFTFVLFYQAQVALNGWLADHGWVPPTLERLFPFLLGQPVLTFVIYAIILDCADYWRHRLSHRFGWWWALHSLHHAQRQMTFWSDDRNHVLDDLIGALWFGVIALADRRAAVAVPAAGAGAAVHREPVARQCAAVVRLAGRAAADLAAVPSRASRGAARRVSGAATTARCCRGGTCCSALRISRRDYVRDRRSHGRGGAGERRLSAAAMGRSAAVCRCGGEARSKSTSPACGRKPAPDLIGVHVWSAVIAASAASAAEEGG